MQRSMTMTDNAKAEKFRTLAEKRVSRAIRIIRRIGNLSRRGTYAYRNEQVEKIFGALRGELDAAQQRFAPPVDAQQVLFKLD